jgi:hypothetical protein
MTKGEEARLIAIEHILVSLLSGVVADQAQAGHEEDEEGAGGIARGLAQGLQCEAIVLSDPLAELARANIARIMKPVIEGADWSDMRAEVRARAVAHVDTIMRLHREGSSEPFPFDEATSSAYEAYGRGAGDRNDPDLWLAVADELRRRRFDQIAPALVANTAVG